MRASGGYTKSESHSYAISNIAYNPASGQTNSYLNQYSTTPGRNYNVSARLGYVEPLGKNWFAEARYQYSYKYNKSDRSRYNLNELNTTDFPGLSDYDASFGSTDESVRPSLGSLPTSDEILNMVRDENNSQYATYKYTDHTATLGIRYNSSAVRFNAGVDFNPEHTKMAYSRRCACATTFQRPTVWKYVTAARHHSPQ